MKSPDPNQILQDDPARLAAMIAEAEAIPRNTETAEDIKAREIESQKTQEAKNRRLERYLSKMAVGRKGAFHHEREMNAQRGVIPTGFNLLDQVLGGGLMPKLYGVGAEPGMGKTAFVLQIADQIAAAGKAHVIIASLEMSANELISRSLSRMTFERALKKFSALGEHDQAGAVLSGNDAASYGLVKSDEILMGGTLLNEQEEALKAAEQLYFDIPATQIVIREAREDVESVDDETGQPYTKKERIGTAQGLRRIVEEHIEAIEEKDIEAGKATPKVLIVDYLQRIKPNDPRTDTRAAVEEAVETLKDISREFNMPVIFVSSIGRASYGEGGGLSSFKESGAIEYTADVAMIMTLSAHREIANPGNGKTPAAMEQARWYNDRMRKADKAEVKFIDITLPKARSGRKAAIQFTLTGAYYCLKEKEEIENFLPIEFCPGTQTARDTSGSKSNDKKNLKGFEWPQQA